MVERAIRLPDVGEGVAEAEVVEWHVKIGDLVQEDATIAAVMTDKATVEIPSPIAGKIVWLAASVGDVVAVGADLARVEVSGGDTVIENEKATKPRTQAAAKAGTPATETAQSDRPSEDRAEHIPAATGLAGSTKEQLPRTASFRRFAGGAPRPEGDKPLASPAVRLRAQEAGVDLRQVPGTGPAGRITHEDLDAFCAPGRATTRTLGLQPRTAVEDIKIVGLRRRIAEKMTLANARIPHITYVEEIDVTALEELRAVLNKNKRSDQPRLTLLPFLMRAMVRGVVEQPNLNALFDDEAGVLHQHAGVHIGIAAQTATGLVVPVVRHAEALDLWACGAELNRLAEAAKKGTASRDELSGSTITITSLGAMGGVATTPIINHPEVAIVGVNKMMVRPVWDGSAFIPRKMMNLSSSFDHRVVDGFDAAQFVQHIKTLLETPALIFMEG
jgi:2-oxoisovalerate dehydrogenase E2 component (dihydrolipoyl transacylase)